MAAIHQNFLSGTLTADPGVGGVTLNSANFAGMQTVATTATPDFMWLTLDPQGVNGAPEVVKVTAHTASATSVTVGRAQQGTVARAHPVGTAWECAWTDADTESLFATPRSGFRNAIINGEFNVWQRGGGAFTTAGTYGADQWATAAVGSTYSASRQSFTLGNTIPGYEPQYFHRTVVTSAAGAGNLIAMQNKIEGVRSFAGQTVTLSFWAKADASKNIAVEFVQSFGTGGSPSADVTAIGSQLVALTTSWKRYAITVSIPSISGKTLGTGNNDFLTFFFWMDAGSSFAARAASLGQQSGTFDFWGVQLEAGSYETPFERRPYATELAMCQRYFHAMANATATTHYATGIALSTTTAVFVIRHPVFMRVPPTLTANGAAGNYFVYNSAAGTTACNALPTLSSSTEFETLVQATTAAASMTIVQATNLISASPGGLLFSAEL